MSGQDYSIEQRARRRRKRRRQVMIRRIIALLILILLIFLLIRGVIAIAHLISKKAAAKSAEKPVTQSAEQKEEPAGDTEEAGIAPAEITMSFTGDIILGMHQNAAYDTSMCAYYDKNGPDYFLQNVQGIFADDDLTVINFESTLTEETEHKNQKFVFKAPPEYIDIIKGKSIEAANLANNHSSDYGEKSYEDTISALEGAGIRHFGFEDTAVFTVKDVKVGIFGIYELDEYGGIAPEVTKRIDELKQEECDIIVGIFHWGYEYRTCPDQDQVNLGHQAIDEGADLVVGHHPHIIEGIEYYNGKPIVYSLGNFCFGGNKNPSEKDTMIYRITFRTDENAKVTGWQDEIVPTWISSTTAYNDYQPVPMGEEDAAAYLEKLTERSNEIKTNFNAEKVYGD